MALKPLAVLVVGANGFLGGFIAAALERHGYWVVRGVRAPRPGDTRERYCDLAGMDERAWDIALDGVDAVVNAAGILRETRTQRFAQVHLEGPSALATASIARDIGRFVQVSSLGVPADGPFIASKHAFDARLQALPLSSTILRPSLVYAASGSYGGTSLLRALAALPGAHWLPGDGRWLVHPVAVEDLAELVVRAVASDIEGVFEVGGPVPMSLREYQAHWRDWLRIGGAHALKVPEVLVSAQVRVWEWIGNGPVGMTMWRMLRRGNVTAPDASERLRAAFGIAPRALPEVLAQRPSQVQDRWHAQLYFLAPALRVAVILLWLVSAYSGLAVSPEIVAEMAQGTRLETIALPLARGGGLLDASLALWLASSWRPRWAIGLMVGTVAAYTLSLGTLLPAAWLDPFGGLAKNLVILPALAVLWVLADRR